jgi:hypothetical protein
MRKIQKISASIMTAFLLYGCSSAAANTSSSSSDDSAAVTAADHSAIVTSVDLDDEDTEESWDTSSCVNVTLNGSTASFSGTGISESASVITINQAGTYVFTGTYNGRIAVNCTAKGTVRIVLNGAEINSSYNSAIEVTKASKVILTCAKGTANKVSDPDSYTLNSDSEPTACIFSKSDLVINGSGSLNVTANYNDGITSKDDLYIINTAIEVTSKDDGIIGKDDLYILNSDIKVTAQGDGLKASNEKDANKGNVIIASGTLELTAGDDGIQAVTEAVINDGTISIKAGDGASASVHTDSNQPMGGFGKGNTAAASASTEEVSSKGIDACGSIVINGGTISINSQDDALHSDTNAYVYHGTLTLQAGDDGIHADTLLEISGGTVDIETCYEGLEALTININDGTINIKATDDGINGSNPSSSESMNDDGSMLNIHGGTVTVSADGDGLDMNGSGTMDGGTVTVYGPTNSGNGALDYNGTFIINGGTLAAGGASGMAQVPSTSSSAYTIDIGTSSGAIQIKDSDGNVIGEYTSSKSYQVLSFTSSSLKAGSTYTIYENGTSIGTATISDAITYVNTSSNGNGMQGGMGGGNRGGQGTQGGNGQQGQGI